MASVKIEEKRLKQLKQQLFGKEQPLHSKEISSKQTSIHSFKQLPKSQTTVINPISLKTDLIKIATFSLIALATQFSLFLANQQGLINLFN